MEQLVQVQPSGEELVGLPLVGDLRLGLLGGKEEAFRWVAAAWNEGRQDRGPRALPLPLGLRIRSGAHVPSPLSETCLADAHASPLVRLWLGHSLAAGLAASPSCLRCRRIAGGWLQACLDGRLLICYS